MNAIHLSRQDFDAYVPKVPCIGISMIDPPRWEGADRRPKIRSRLCVETLEVEPFHDIEPPDLKMVPDYVLFDQARAEAIAAFIAKHNAAGIPLVVAHCEAGISRSAAVAGAVQDYLSPWTKISSENRTWCEPLGYKSAFKTGRPNMHVYRLLVRALVAAIPGNTIHE